MWKTTTRKYFPHWLCQMHFHVLMGAQETCMNSFLPQLDAESKILSLRNDAQERTGQNLTRPSQQWGSKGCKQDFPVQGKAPKTHKLCMKNLGHFWRPCRRIISPKPGFIHLDQWLRALGKASPPNQGTQAASGTAEGLQNVRRVLRLINPIKHQHWKRLIKRKADFRPLWPWAVNEVQILSPGAGVAWWKQDRLQGNLQDRHRSCLSPVYPLLLMDTARDVGMMGLLTRSSLWHIERKQKWFFSQSTHYVQNNNPPHPLWQNNT